MRNFVAFCLAAFVGSVALQSAQAATMEYDYSTGNIVFKELANPIGLTIRSASGKLLGDGGLNIGQLYDKALAPNALAWSNFGGFGTGPHTAGLVVAPKTPASDLTFEFVAGFGSPVATGTVSVINNIPEPATIAMAGLGAIGLVAAARRRNA